MAEPLQLGYAASNMAATLSAMMPQFYDGASNPANLSGSQSPVVCDPSGAVQAHATAALTHITTINSIAVTGVYKLTVTIDSTGLPGGTYTVAFTGGTISTGGLSIDTTGLVVANFTVTTTGTPPGPPTPTPSGPMTTSYTGLTTRLAWDLFGLRPDSNGNVWQTPVVDSHQLADIEACIRDGLNMVYSAWRWSFLRNISTITTYAPYTTGSLTISSAGLVTLNNGTAPSDGGFPSNAEMAGAQIAISQSGTTGIWLVATYTSATSLTLVNYNSGAMPATSIILTAPVSGNYTLTWNALTTASIAPNASATAIKTALNLLSGSAFTVTGVYPTFNITGDVGIPVTVASGTATIAVTGLPYQLVFNHYPLPTGYDTAEEEMTEYSPSGLFHHHVLRKLDELEIRRRLQRWYTPRHPEAYALTTSPYNPENNPATPRYVTFYPIPESIRTYQFKATLRPTMIDSTNQFPLGDEVLSPVLMESCLASAERMIKGLSPTNPMAVHSQAVGPLLQMAILRDKQYASPDTVGVMGSGTRHREHEHHWRGGEIHLIGGFGGVSDQWIPG